MKFELDDAQREFASVVRQFFERCAPLAEVRRQMVTMDGFDRDHWMQMASQLGLQGIAVDERYGGSGQSMVELAIVMREAGRALSSTPVFASIGLAAQVLAVCDDETAKATWLPGLASGEVIGTIAVVGSDAEWAPSAAGVRANPADDGWQLRGNRDFVLHGHVADLILVLAETQDGAGIFAVSADAPGLTRTPRPTLDPTRTQASVTFADTPAQLIGQVGEAMHVLDHALRLGAVALAHEQVGAAECCLEMSVEYAKTRHQYGRAIGSFQAIKHMCADVLVEVESSSAIADYAAVVAREDLREELPAVASMAKAFCSDAFVLAAGENIQIHGGIGFTWEHDAHLFYKRAVSSAQHLGSPASHRELIAAAVLPAATSQVLHTWLPWPARRGRPTIQRGSSE